MGGPIFLTMPGLVLALQFLWAAVCAAASAPLFLSTGPPDLELRQGVRHESEHRGVPVRKYWLNVKELPQEARAFVQHPTGDLSELELDRSGEGVSFSLGLPMGDGPMHGVHNSYVVATEVAGRELLVRVAKWITIHHSCSWGHHQKYEVDRIRASHSDSIPLEIVCQGLWDGNFHSNTRSGDTIEAQVLHYGHPLRGVPVKLVTSRGWSRETQSHETGVASFQLIRDYYPDWKDFHSSHRDRFSLVTEYEMEGAGEYRGRPYDGTRILSTVSWVYSPSRRDYTSYESGLFLGALGLSVSGLSVAIYRHRRQRPYREVVFHERD